MIQRLNRYRDCRKDGIILKWREPEVISGTAEKMKKYIIVFYKNTGQALKSLTCIILHRAILVSLDMRYARKVKLAFIVSTISR